jgi:hypothetical protein
LAKHSVSSWFPTCGMHMPLVRADALASAKAANLRYVTGEGPGILRKRRHVAASPFAGDPASLGKRLDLPQRERPHSSRWPRRQRPEAIPLSSALSGSPRRDEVRTNSRLRGSASENTRTGEQSLRSHFRGKSHQEHDITLWDRGSRES